MKRKSVTFRRHWAARALNYLLLLPVILVIRPIWESHTAADIIIYILGFCLLLGLILFNNSQPYIRAEKKHLLISPFYSSKPEQHPYEYMLGYRYIGKNILKIYSYEHRPISLILAAKDRNPLISLLKEHNIDEAPKEH